MPEPQPVGFAASASSFRFLDLNLVPRLWRYTWPTIAHSLLQWLVGVVNVKLVGTLGPQAISAVGFSQQLMMVILVCVLAVSTGSMTLVAQTHGAENEEDLSTAARQGLLLAVGVGVLVAIVGSLLARPMLVQMGARGEVLRLATPYLQLIFCGIVFMLPDFIVASIFRGAGDMVTPLKIAAALNLINIFTNYVFIFGIGPFPRLEVMGAAVGSLVARSIAAAWGVALLSSGKAIVKVRWRGGRVLDPPMMWRILRIGVPSAIQGLFRNGARILFFRIVATSSGPAVTTATAALTIGFQVRMIIIMPALAFGSAATALVGQALGARDPNQAGHLGAQTIRLCVALMLLVNGALFLAAEPLVAFFTTSAEVIRLGSELLRYFACSEVFSALSIAAGGALTGGGDTKPPMYYTGIGQWLILLPATHYLLGHTSLGLTGAWMAWAVAPVVQATLTYLRFQSGVWKHLNP